MTAYTAIRSEGGLIPFDIIDRIAREDLPGQKASDFGFDRGRRLTDEIARAWSDALDYWHIFKRRAEALPENDPGTTLTRERWVAVLLTDLLGYNLAAQRAGAEIGGRTYPVSHRAGAGEEAPPVHIVGFRQDLDRRPESGHRRMSPQALVQEYLNRSEHLWGVVTNGLRLRLLRDSTRTARPTYLEFDLESILGGGRFNEFTLFYRLCHRTRLPKTVEDGSECLLERYYQASIEEGTRVRDHLRDGVEAALKQLGNGLLQHPANEGLRQAVESGRLSAAEYYRQLLRLIYRLLFLMVAEERQMILAVGANTERSQRIYDEHYSIRSLRDRAEQPVEQSPYCDLWIRLQQTFGLFTATAGNPLGIPPLNGDLFGPDAIPALERTSLYNHDLLAAMRHLSLFRAGGVWQRVNYAGLDVEELGSVYESLLDFQPAIRRDGEKCQFELLTGTERKSTGSYYTHPGLVAELVQSALVPVLEDRLRNAATVKDKEEAILGMTVCDPATGSGHFLLAAARRLGRELARVRTGEDEPTPEEFRRAVRDVIRHCIYGVDINPLAVDLCKLALWIEGHNVGLPLTFLDHRIKLGNSLIGVFSDRPPSQVPEEAFEPVTGDVRQFALSVKRQNRAERRGQTVIPFGEPEPVSEGDIAAYRAIIDLPENAPQEVGDKKRRYEEWQASEVVRRLKLECDVWCAAFFWPLVDVNAWVPTTGNYLRVLSEPNSIPRSAREQIARLAEEHRFFHWHLEFPDVFARGGFDVVLGNPPWETWQPEENQFFAGPAPEIARLPGAQRKKAIERLEILAPDLHAAWGEYSRHIETAGKFMRDSGCLPFAVGGKINLYAVFAERSHQLLSRDGRAGIVVQSGVATDDSNKRFFGHLASGRRLRSLYDFENRAALFPGVHRMMKFCLLTLGRGDQAARFCFFAQVPEHLDDERRVFKLSSEDFALLNPNTRTCPVFRTRADAELTKAIYRRMPVLVREAQDDRPEENPWGVSFMQMINMTSMSSLFKTATDFPGGVPDDHLPLYEAKMMHQFDHRWATYVGVTGDDLRKGLARELTDTDKRDPNRTVQPRYWVPSAEVGQRLREHGQRRWLIGFRDITNAMNERTAIFSIMPRVGVGNNAPLLLTDASTGKVACLLANLDALAFDYVARTKIAGTHMNFFFVKQLPALPPDCYSQADLDFIGPRVLELTYTAWDLKPFAEDFGYDGPPFTWDPERRAVLRAELDAYYAHLYGLNRKQLRYILDPHGLSAKELEDILDPWEDPTCSGPHLLPAEPALDFPGETFRVLKEKEERLYGEYRTRRLVLEAWHRLHLGNP